MTDYFVGIVNGLIDTALKTDADKVRLAFNVPKIRSGWTVVIEVIKDGT